jgi:hypothetical protein
VPACWRAVETTPDGEVHPALQFGLISLIMMLIVSGIALGITLAGTLRRRFREAGPEIAMAPCAVGAIPMTEPKPV